jgi:hypothetical protein
MPAAYRFCDGFTRRQVIRAGLFGVAGLTLPDVLRLRARAEQAPDTAVIYILQEGGASQFETWDPKPDAAEDIRGEFGSIATKVPGVRFCDILPEQAHVMDKLTILRSVHHPSTQHSSSVHLIKTGYYCRPDSNVNEMPSVGACVARLRGAARPGLPPYVLLANGARYDYGHYLGQGYNPFEVLKDPSAADFQMPNLTLVEGLTADRLADRKALLAQFDAVQRLHDRKGEAAACDAFTRQAFEMVTGPRARQAFDLAAEPLALRERYGRNRIGQSLLMARRLVEHGVSFVTVGTFGWDYHGDLWKQSKRDMPPFDRGVAALVEDLYTRGLEKRVLVVCMGEFGRTPKISTINNLPPGRDHWGDAMSVLLAGGGFRGGRVIGATDAKGAVPKESPCRLEQVLALMYRHLGIDPAHTFDDASGRPRSLLDIREPIPGLA